MINNKYLSNLQTKEILVASIDIGTNSTHLLIAEIDLNLKSFSIKFTDKSTTRLGERDEEGNLSEESIQRALITLRRFKEYCKSNNVNHILTAATSAVREAPNSQEFIKRVLDEIGIKIELISGAEEARLIYLGVLSGMPFEDQSYVIVDIGGGSTELILADKKDALALTSARVGAVRLKNDFLNSGAINSERSRFLKIFIQGSLEPSVLKIKRRLKNDKPVSMIATSGTATSLGNLILDELGQPKQKIHGYKLKRENLEVILERLMKMPSSEIKKISSLSERRAEIIIPGALILTTSMEMMNFDELTISERALREGLVVDWMLRKGIIKNEFNIQSNIRKTTIIHQANKFGVDRGRCEKVINIAFEIFNQTKNIFHNEDINSKAKELLWAACNLYNCGKYVNISSYHKHSWYLIKNCELLGYSQAETNIIASIARYHRKTLPKKRHVSWQDLLSKEDKTLVLEMSLILRLAASLDQRPENLISSLQIKLQNNILTFELLPFDKNHDLLLEKWSLESCRNIVKELKNLELKVL